MDPTKSSLSSKTPHMNGGGNGSPVDDLMGSWRDGVDGERQRDRETKEAETGDVTTAAAESNFHHKGSADKQKFNSVGYQRRTKQKVVTDFATVSKGTSVGAKPRAALRQVLFNQGVSDKNPAPEGQLDLLKHNLEAFTVPVSLKWSWNDENQGSTLETNWTDIVYSHFTMSKMQRNQQEALWEFVHTELTYINKLLIMRDLVVKSLLYLHQHGFLLEVTPQLLFSNLPSIISAHQLFWQDVIYPMLQEVRRTNEPFDPMRLKAGCLQFHKRFSSYKQYCWEENSNQEFAHRHMESNPQFFAYVQWVETHPQVERMRLGDMQAKPHMRITKYPLLLKAVLKSTSDAEVQQALREMLSSVNTFLESINDYLRLKDEDLALSISAQRVEGYEVEGINEEIDKHVKEVSRFDLTCPIRDVGPEVIRRLLLEENLKIRGRKDSKLEVVALLFSDVLLMTKVQKKGERLKVIRPPLALDRTVCIALKDGCSFVLVEVGELHSVMNVYIFVTGTPNSCSTWVSTIHQAKKTLRNLREKERNRQMEKWKLQQEPVTEVKGDDPETIHQTLTQSEEDTFVEKLNEELIKTKAINGVLSSKEPDEQYQSFDHSPFNGEMPFWQPQPRESQPKSPRKPFAARQPVAGYEWIELGVRGSQSRTRSESHIKEVESSCTTRSERMWNHNLEQHFNFNTSGKTLHTHSTRPYSPLPDVDYPLNEDVSQQTASELQISPGSEVILRRRAWVGVNQEAMRNFTHSHPGRMDSSEAGGFPKVIKSPVLRRRRPISTHQGSSHTSKQELGATLRWSVSNNSSSDSDGSVPSKRSSVPPDKDSLRVFKLSSLRQGMFWTMNDDRGFPDPQTLSEPEFPDLNLYNKRARMKAHRSASIPNILLHPSSNLYQPSGSVCTLPQADKPPPSPLQGLLNRAKDRDRETLKRDNTIKKSNVKPTFPPPSPSFSTTPSLSASGGDRDAEWEEEVELLRYRALSVSKGWKEQLVDGDDDDKRNSIIFSDGVNVDWAGWCFDDEEVMDHLQPGSEGLLEGITRTLASLDLHELAEHEDGECSQV